MYRPPPGTWRTPYNNLARIGMFLCVVWVETKVYILASKGHSGQGWFWTQIRKKIGAHDHVQLSRSQGQPSTRLAVSAQPSRTESGESGPGSECTGAAPGCPGYNQFSGWSHFNEKGLMHMKSAHRGGEKSRVCVGGWEKGVYLVVPLPWTACQYVCMEGTLGREMGSLGSLGSFCRLWSPALWYILTLGESSPHQKGLTTLFFFFSF